MVPSLVSCCLQLLVPFADEIELPVALRLRPHDTLLDGLVPDPAQLDPKLWAVLIQVYETLPPYFRTLTLPLTSPHVSLLQDLAPNPNFSLVTLVSLSACPDLTDESILLFKSLHTLVGLDASCTTLTSHAIYTLGAILQRNYENDSVRHHRGPWELRILSLRNCKQINDDVYPYLNKFPLLAVVDLRGTQCTSPNDSPFEPCSLTTFHHPISMADSIAELQSVQPDLFLSKNPYILKVDKIKLPQVHRKHVPDVAPQDAVVVIPANPYRPVKVGNTHVLELQKQRVEERDKHERNKEAWYERQERLEERQFNMTDDDFFGYDRDNYPERTGKHNMSGKDSNTEIRNECDPNLPPSTKRPRRLCTPKLYADDAPVYYPGRNPYLLAKRALDTRNRFGTPEYRTILRPNPTSTSHTHPSTTMDSVTRQRALNPNYLTRDAVVEPPSTDGISSSSTGSFYSRPPAFMPKPKPPLLRTMEEGDPALKLYREPQPYSNLSSTLTGSSKRARASGDNNEYEYEFASERSSNRPLKQAAVVDQTGTRAERARQAMQIAVQSRMSTVASSSKTPVKRSDFAPDESVLKKRRNIVPLFESSFPSESTDGTAPARARNPFRKSLPSQSALAGFTDPPVFDFPATSKAVESKAPSRKAVHRHSLNNTALTITTTPPPRLKPSKSTTDLRSSDFSALSASTSSTSTFTTSKVGYRPPPRPASPPNTKPLVPISSIKIPVLPEPLRKEVAAMEKAEIEKIKRATERKRKKREEEEEEGATDSDEAELKRALKKRASLAKIGAGAKKDKRVGDASTLGMGDERVSGTAKASASTVKGKGKVSAGKKGSFDWKGWAKK